MKKRKELTKGQKKAAIIIVIFAVLVVAIGFFVGYKATASPMDDEELKECEVVAQFIFDQTQANHGIIEVPEGYSIKMSETQITVSKDGHSG